MGILKADVVPQSQSGYSYQWRDCNGWAIGNSGQVHKDGSYTSDASLNNSFKQGDTVEVVLNCDAGKLSLHLPAGHQHHMDIPKSQSWRLHVNLHGANDKIRIVEVAQE